MSFSPSRHAAAFLTASKREIAVSRRTGHALLRSLLLTTPRSNSTRVRLRCNHVGVQDFSTQTRVRAVPSGYMTLLPARVKAARSKTKTVKKTKKAFPARFMTPGDGKFETVNKLSGDPVDELPDFHDLPSKFKAGSTPAYGSRPGEIIQVDVDLDSFPTFIVHRGPTRSFVPATGPPSTLKPGARIRCVTWNLDRHLEAYPARIKKALEELWQRFGQEPEPLVIMFQEMTREGEAALCKLELVRENFYVARIPRALLAGSRWKPGTAFWASPASYCITLTSKLLPKPRVTTIQYGSWQFTNSHQAPKHAVIMDLPVHPSGLLRLVNIHLSLGRTEMARYTRYRQLRELSMLVNKTARHKSSPVVASVVGGDFNFNYKTEMFDCLAKIEPTFKDAVYGDGLLAIGKLQRMAECGDFPNINSIAVDRFLYTGHIDNFGKHALLGVLEAENLSVDCPVWELTRSDKSMPIQFLSDHHFERHADVPSKIRYPAIPVQWGFYSLPVKRTWKTIPVCSRPALMTVFELGNDLEDSGKSKKKSGASRRKRG
ncbi:hypothetical protein V8F33_008253 [Rhypophila sp. PSN 637]